MRGAKKLCLPSFLPPISTWTLERWLKDVTRESSLWFTASCEWLNVSICLLISTSLFCLCITLAAWTDALSALISSLNFSTSSFAFLSLSKAMANWSLRLWRGKENIIIYLNNDQLSLALTNKNDNLLLAIWIHSPYGPSSGIIRHYKRFGNWMITGTIRLHQILAGIIEVN